MNPFFLFLVLLLVGAGCDFADGDDGDGSPPPAEAFSLVGTWQATVAEAFTTGYVLPEWASVDSVDFGYDGAHVLTLTIEEAPGEDGTVTGTLDWKETASYTVTEYAGGAADADTDLIDGTKTGAVAATYVSDDASLHSFASDHLSIDALLKNADITFDEDEIGRVTLTHIYLSKTYVGTGGEATYYFVVPLVLEFGRVQ